MTDTRDIGAVRRVLICRVLDFGPKGEDAAELMS